MWENVFVFSLEKLMKYFFCNKKCIIPIKKKKRPPHFVPIYSFRRNWLTAHISVYIVFTIEYVNALERKFRLIEFFNKYWIQKFIYLFAMGRQKNITRTTNRNRFPKNMAKRLKILAFWKFGFTIHKILGYKAIAHTLVSYFMVTCL